MRTEQLTRFTQPSGEGFTAGSQNRFETDPRMAGLRSSAFVGHIRRLSTLEPRDRSRSTKVKTPAPGKPIVKGVGELGRLQARSLSFLSHVRLGPAPSHGLSLSHELDVSNCVGSGRPFNPGPVSCTPSVHFSISFESAPEHSSRLKRTWER